MKEDRPGDVCGNRYSVKAGHKLIFRYKDSRDHQEIERDISLDLLLDLSDFNLAFPLDYDF